MAEISEAHYSDSSKLQDNDSEARNRPESEPDFDPKLMRFPFLWKSVEIYRSPLLFSEIDSNDDVAVDKRLASVYGGETKGYSVVVVKGGKKKGISISTSKSERAVVGKHRHVWMVVGDGSEVEVAALKVAELLVKVFIDGGREEGDFEKIDDTLLAPMIEALGRGKHQCRESGQGSSSFLISFVNSNEWHLDTSIAAGGRSKILQFAVYVPSAKEFPLLLQLPNGEISKTNGFISPGGFIVWNPQGCLKDSEFEPSVKNIIPIQDLESMFEVFIGQFRELDILSWQQICFNLHSCATTLGSFSRLVQSLPRMINMDEIGKQVKFSLEAAKLPLSNASSGAYEYTAGLWQRMPFPTHRLSISYYSFEHCFAVYSPFFLPVSMHVMLAALRELRRYKQEKAKYLAWKAIENAAS
ncbi:cysteine-rich receptor-like protein kinase 10-like [Hibiscus syriacus]|uniref:Cysteine-rich receptor-like protein kinase 10-like n=1 Tax=Hibiscus syriacus TaxID=106335 RepID=A0A6A2Z347_HIBSY|nr:cysteine-rich receptor-like protein kinase 10-like [Hibiscus syriacus]